MVARFRIVSTVFFVAALLIASVMTSLTADHASLAGPIDENTQMIYFPRTVYQHPSAAIVVPFDRFPDGTIITTDTILNGDEFSESGILLAGAPTGSYCADANTTAIHVPPHSSGGLDFTFLTSSSPNSLLGCNSIEVEFTFLQPVRQVTITFGGAAVNYVLIAYDDADNELGVAVQMGGVGLGTFEVNFGAVTPNIKRVTFGHEGAVTAVTEISYRR